MSKSKDFLLEEGQSMFMKDLMTVPAEDMTVEEQHFVWSVLDLFDKACKKRKEELRDRLIETVEAKGIKNEKGHTVLILPDGEVKKEARKRADTAKEGILREILQKKGLDPDVVFVKKTSYEFDAKAFKKLLDEGYVTKEEVKECFIDGKVSYALKVRKPGMLPKQLLEG